MFSDAIAISNEEKIKGNLIKFRDFETNLEIDKEFNDELLNLCKSENISAAGIDSNLLRRFNKDYELDQLAKVGWSRIPHFYNSFYVYKYATGCSAGVSFAQDILKNGSDNYINFLKKGGSDYPINVLKDAGVNLTSTKPIEDTINKFDSLVKELEKLVSK